MENTFVSRRRGTYLRKHANDSLVLAKPLQQVDRTYVLHRGRKLTYFGGCDYFRLSSHPSVLGALKAGLRKYGLNVAASRVTTGNHELYQLLEQRLTDFFGVESATLVSNGYVANMAVAQALAGEFSHVLIDERAHASLFDAAQFLDCRVIRFKHRDVRDALRALRRCGAGTKVILLTDGMFAHDGEVAPLLAYLHALPPRGIILLDDAHGAGTLGKTGRGTVEYLNVSTKRIIRTVTLSKAFGVYGGVVLSPRLLAREIHARSPLFAGNTPLPLPLAAAALESLEVLEPGKRLRWRLERNTRYVKETLRRGGIPVAETPSPIVSLVPRFATEAEGLQRRLLARGIFPSFIRYPGGSDGGYFRFAISSEHSRKQLDALLEAMLARPRG